MVRVTVRNSVNGAVKTLTPSNAAELLRFVLRSRQFGEGTLEEEATEDGVLSGTILAEGASYVWYPSAAPPPPPGPSASGQERSHEIMQQLCPPLDTLPASATAAASYLGSVDGMKVPVVDVAFNWAVTNDHASQNLLTIAPGVFQGSQLLCRCSVILRAAYVEHGSEQSTVLNCAARIRDLLVEFDQYSERRISLDLRYNKAASSGASSAVVKQLKRPDMTGFANQCTLVVAEDKPDGNLHGAVADIQNKLKNLNVLHYGSVGYLLGYAASGPLVQFYVITVSGETVDLHDAGTQLDLRTASARATLILRVAKMYRLLQRMAISLPSIAARHRLFEEIKRAGNVTIVFQADSVYKRIENFSSYAAKHQTSLQVLRQAYVAAQNSAHERARTRQPPVLVTPASEPQVSRGDCYSVSTKPLGCIVLPNNEAELRVCARCCCEAAKVLHKAGIVHRDFRWENIVQLQPSSTWMVIDLELAAEAGTDLPPDYSLRGWDDDVASWDDDVPGKARRRRIYTKFSDMRLIGLMLSDIISRQGIHVSPLTQTFINKLLAKQMSAEQALEHEWLKV